MALSARCLFAVLDCVDGSRNWQQQAYGHRRAHYGRALPSAAKPQFQCRQMDTVGGQGHSSAGACQPCSMSVCAALPLSVALLACGVGSLVRGIVLLVSSTLTSLIQFLVDDGSMQRAVSGSDMTITDHISKLIGAVVLVHVGSRLMFALSGPSQLRKYHQLGCPCTFQPACTVQNLCGIQRQPGAQRWNSTFASTLRILRRQRDSNESSDMPVAKRRRRHTNQVW